MFRKLAILCFLTCFLQTAQAHMFFIDDIIDNVKEQIDRKLTPFYIRVKDTLVDAKETVSYTPRKLKLKLFYKDDLVKKIRNLDPVELEEVFNSMLDIFIETVDDEYDLDGELVFSLETIKTASTDPGYFEAHFISNDIVLDKSQNIKFSFDVEDFMDYYNINRDIIDSHQEDNLKIKPITIEITKDFSFETDASAYDPEKDFFEPQILTANFPKTHTLESAQELSFETYRKGRIKRSFAKLPNKKFVLEPELLAELSELLIENSDSYQIRIPFRIDLSNPSKSIFFTSGKKFQVEIPIRIETMTNDGLETRIKIFPKRKLVVL